ncbi:MAG: sporulation integral membrane protein YlbJ [Clostridia bacterium]|jgi:sporulation integral membrane protein YlbJ|nr:sporulation integral membrane protein YlbJ [Clostridia bacterium]
MSCSIWNKRRKKLFSSFSALAVTLIVIAMLLWPEETYQGALYGLELWATILVPSLLPFFIIAEIIMSLGIVRMLGVLMEPLMRPLFNLPGSASFVIAMGFTSGFPMGAVLTKRFCEEKECTLSEAERLIAFTNNSSPLFLMVAVAVGMFQQISLGIILAISHYLANILLGIFLGLKDRFSINTRNDKLYSFPAVQSKTKGQSSSLILKSIHVFFQAQEKRKPWGKLLSEAISSGINTICLIGGFVIIYAVLIRILKVTSVLNLLLYPCSALLQICGLDTCLDLALATGFWEMTLGLKEVALSSASLQEKAIIASILLGWGGLSIQSQVTGVVSGTGINLHLYYKGRIVQGLLAGLITYLLTLNNNLFPTLTAPTITPIQPQKPFLPLFIYNFFYTGNLFYLTMLSLLVISCLTLSLNFLLKKINR